MVASLAAKDGLLIRDITRSDLIRKAIQYKRLKLPKSEGEVTKLILHFNEDEKKEGKNTV